MKNIIIHIRSALADMNNGSRALFEIPTNDDSPRRNRGEDHVSKLG
jgi:hypothetical protein